MSTVTKQTLDQVRRLAQLNYDGHARNLADTRAQLVEAAAGTDYDRIIETAKDLTYFDQSRLTYYRVLVAIDSAIVGQGGAVDLLAELYSLSRESFFWAGTDAREKARDNVLHEVWSMLLQHTASADREQSIAIARMHRED